MCHCMCRACSGNNNISSYWPLVPATSMYDASFHFLGKLSDLQLEGVLYAVSRHFCFVAFHKGDDLFSSMAK